MERRKLGRQGLSVSSVGLGCMSLGIADIYSSAIRSDDEAVALIHRAIDLGVTFLDTANIYGDSELKVGKALKGRRDQVELATKFGFTEASSSAPRTGGIDGRPEAVRKACDTSLQRLGVAHIDLHYLHRVDPDVPIEETVGAMADLVHAGKVRYLGLSEASAGTVRRAAAVHPIAALQTEWSLFSRDIEAEILPACRELGVGLVPYSPLGRGLLTGAVSSLDELQSDDFRRTQPRFQGDNLQRNLALVAVVQDIAANLGATPGQVALAWLQAQGDDVVPIPGTKRRRYLEENVAALDVELSADDVARLEALQPIGTRYADTGWVNRETPAQSSASAP